MALNIVTKTDDRVAVRHVLMSVSDKKGLEAFVPELVKSCPGVKIYSTGGTYTKVKEILGDKAAETLVAVHTARSCRCSHTFLMSGYCTYCGLGTSICCVPSLVFSSMGA